MSDARQVFPALGLVVTMAIAIHMVGRLDGQGGGAVDFSQATTADAIDNHGVVLIQGTFELVEDDDDDIERRAVLEPTTDGGQASGDAEIELSRTSPVEQEIEFSVRNAVPGTELTFRIDGQAVGRATVDRRGRADLELDVQPR